MGFGFIIARFAGGVSSPPFGISVWCGAALALIGVVVLVFPLVILVFSAISAMAGYGTSSILNPGPHGLSEIIYAFTSQAGNNGSAFAGNPLVQHSGRHHDVGRPVPDDRSGVGNRRKSCRQEIRSTIFGDVPRDHASIHSTVDRRDPHRRCTDIFPSIKSWPNP